MTAVNPEPLPQAEYEAIYKRVPRLTVEVVLVSDGHVLLSRRGSGPCAGLWHLPGGTVRYGEPLIDAVNRVAREELGTDVVVEGLLGYIEYPSHYQAGIDWPVGVAFRARLTPEASQRFRPDGVGAAWFAELPAEQHEEQRQFLATAGLLGSRD